ncbi:MAG: histidine kinase [Bradymonadaceae bacterium]
MLEALQLVVRLLEKVSVLVSVALVLLLLRPAEVWLGETGPEASFRRRLFLAAILGALAIWGAFLGFEIEGVQFDVRMVGILVGGYLGGAWVGATVGGAAGGLSALVLGQPALGAAAGSAVCGYLAGEWSRRWGTGLTTLVVGAVSVQAVYHVGVWFAAAVFGLGGGARIPSQLELYAAQVAANTAGVAVFMGLLKLVRELDRAREEVETSRDLVRSARLEALQYQVRPHFLFNLLNTLAYLIRTEPARARELTLDLAEFLRYSLSESADRMTLAEEIEQIERYVDLERARFGEGLDFAVAASPGEQASELPVPPLILQPLVENAIRHGAEDGEVEVRLEVHRRGDEAVVAVLDDGPGPPEKWRERPQTVEPASDAAGPGVGLTNVRERLQRFYRGRAGLSLESRPEGGARAEVVVPLDEVEEEEFGFREQAREKLKKVLA